MSFADFRGTAVFDSNIWVFGITGENTFAEHLLQKVVDGDIQVPVSAYIYDEVYEAFNRSLSGEMVNEAKHDFTEFVFDSPSVSGPTQQELRKMDLDEIRSQPEMQMLGRILGIQPKDVPVVVLAWQWKEDRPSIFTADKPFAEFSPLDHGLPEISSVYVPTERTL